MICFIKIYLMIKDLHSLARIAVPLPEVLSHFFPLNLLRVFEGLWFVPMFGSPSFKHKFSKPGATTVRKFFLFLQSESIK